MSINYNKTHTKDEIENVLRIIKECILKDRYDISLNVNRQENIIFISNYDITEAKQKEIFLNLKVENFCHSLKNKKIGFEHEILYVFMPEVKLIDIMANEVDIIIYIKFNIIERNKDNNVIVISFHEANKSPDYLFA